MAISDLLNTDPFKQDVKTYVELPYDLNLLRGWQRDQLKLLRKLCDHKMVNGAQMANASGTAIRSSEFGGKMTALTRAKLMVKAGREKDGNNLYQLNEKKVERNKLSDFLKEMDI